MRSHRASLILTAVPLLLLGAACSDDDSDGSSTTDGIVVDDSTIVDDTVGVDDTVSVDDTVAVDDTVMVDDTAAVDDTASDDTTADSVDEADDSADTTNVVDRFSAASEALSDGDFSTMLQALSLSSLGDELEDRAVTILAPTNDAFTSLSADELRDLLANPTEIDDVLRRHVIDEALTFDELSARETVTVLSGDTLTVATTGSTVTVDGAVVTPPDDEAVSGEEGQEVVVFRIDRVLLPS